MPILKRGDLEQILPHRGIALALDAAIYAPVYGGVVGFKKVRADEVRLEGHFEIYPGHWIYEGMNLSAALLATLTCNDLKGVPIATVVEGLKFKGMITAGAKLLFIPKLVKNRANKFLVFKVIVKSGRQIIAEGRIKGAVVSP